ncbi:MAG: DUF3006 domain-containing protein [Peptococcaceae bacterium]|nr:DUF3006 domain-containing protein [Peptococcaceae bacterium]
MLIIDRFEGDFAVCENDARRMIHIRRSEIPVQATEGDCLIADPQKGYVLDTDETARRKARIKAKMNRLFTE